MIIFLYGRDSYQIKEGLEKIVDEYKKKHVDTMSFSILSTEKETDSDLASKVEDLLKTVSFFDEKRLIVVRNPFSINKQLATLIKTWDLSLDKNQILVLVEEASEAELVKKDKKLFAMLAAKPNISKSFEPLGGGQLESRINKEIKSLGLTIEQPAMRLLIDYTAGNLNKNETLQLAVSWRLKQEIDKLVNYKIASDDKTITVPDIKLLITPRVNLNIFETVDAIASKNKLKATALVWHHLENSEDPYSLFNIIVYQFRNLLRVKSLIKNAVPYPDIIKKTGLHPFVVRKTYDQSKNFDLEELVSLFSRLAQTEANAKNGKIDMSDGLYQFIFSMN